MVTTCSKFVKIDRLSSHSACLREKNTQNVGIKVEIRAIYLDESRDSKERGI